MVLLALYLSFVASVKQPTNKQLLKVYNSFLRKEQQTLAQQPPANDFDVFSDNFDSLCQIGEKINNHIESGSRPPDETLVDTLTMMKSMLA